LRSSATGARRDRAIEESLKGSLCAGIGVGRSQKAMRGMMAKINAAQFPHELTDIQLAPQVSELKCPLNKLHQRMAPGGFHLEYFVPDPALNVVELEQTGSHRTPAWQTGPLRPSKPIPHQRAQPRKPFRHRHGRPHHVFGYEFGHVIQQLDLDVFLGAKVREQAALRHADLIGENAQRDPAQTRLAHQGEALVQDSLAS
jgi:hypothetical protein